MTFPQNHVIESYAVSGEYLPFRYGFVVYDGGVHEEGSLFRDFDIRSFVFWLCRYGIQKVPL